MSPRRSLLVRSSLACLLALWSVPGDPGLQAGQDLKGEVPAACPAQISRDVLVAGGEHGEIHLASGRTITLSDVRTAAAGDDTQASARAFFESQIGEQVELRLGSDETDRWGRMRAAVVLSPDTARLDLAHALVARGLAIVDTGAERLCDESLLLREEQARRSGRGLWSRADARPLDALDSAGLLARIGSFTIVEGVVRNVGERERRTYIDFGRSWDGAFTVIVPSRLWAKVRDAGMDAATLKGRRIRIRGIMQNWRGPAIELTTVEFIEKLETRPFRP